MSGSQWSENICADEGGLGLTERSAERRAELELSTVFWPQRRPGRTEVVRRDRRRKWRDSTGADLRFSGIWAKRANGLTGAAIGASGTRKCPQRSAHKGWHVCGHFRANNGRPCRTVRQRAKNRLRVGRARALRKRIIGYRGDK